MSNQFRYKGHYAVDDTAEIDAHDPIPVVIRQLVDRSRAIYTSVVEHEVNCAKSIERRVARRGKRIAIRHVNDKRPDVRSAAAQFLDGSAKRVFLDISEGDLHARTRESFRNSQADPASAAGDIRDLSSLAFHTKKSSS